MDKPDLFAQPGTNIVPDVHKIGLLRTRSLGDMIFSLPAIAALHTTYPQAEILFMGHRWHAELLVGRVPGISQVIPVPAPQQDQLLQGAVIGEGERADFIRRMRAEKLDIGIQMNGGGETSNPLIHQCQPRVSVGAKSPRAESLDRWIPFSPYQSDVVRNLEIVALVGAQTSTVALQPLLPVLDSDLVEAEPFLEKIQEPYLVIHPGSTDPRRRWSPEKYAQVADFCQRELGLKVILLGTNIDRLQVQAVQEAMQTEAIDLCGKLPLPALIGVLSMARLMIANDSGPLHLGLATGTSAVGMFMAEYITNSLPLYRSNFLPLISWERQCPRCGVWCDKVELEKKNPQPCNHHVSFLESIEIEAAIRAIQELLSLRHQTGLPSV